jgi:SulP family sulfate permease
MSARPAEPTFSEMFTPKLVTVLKEGYGLAHLRADRRRAHRRDRRHAALNGNCDRLWRDSRRGLYTAIVRGFLVSALGGSRFQIGGPAGAFIVLVTATVQ